MKRIGPSILSRSKHSSGVRQKKLSMNQMAAVFTICVLTVASPTLATTIGINQKDSIAQHFLADTPVVPDIYEVEETIKKPNKIHKTLPSQRPRGFFKFNAINRNQMVRGGSVLPHDEQ